MALEEAASEEVRKMLLETGGKGFLVMQWQRVQQHHNLQ